MVLSSPSINYVFEISVKEGSIGDVRSLATATATGYMLRRSVVSTDARSWPYATPLSEHVDIEVWGYDKVLCYLKKHSLNKVKIIITRNKEIYQCK